MVSQLREADALDKLDEVLANMSSTRADLGYPPLVTPMSQMVGAQAVSNVLFGRYAVISDPVKEYVRGNYGRPVSEISAEIVDKVVEGDGGKSAPPPERPGAVLEPELDAARVAVADMTDDIDDVLTYALYPQTGLSFLRVKHGLEQAAEATPDESEAAETTVSPSPKAPRSSRARRFNVYVGDSFFRGRRGPGWRQFPCPTATNKVVYPCGGSGSASLTRPDRIRRRGRNACQIAHARHTSQPGSGSGPADRVWGTPSRLGSHEDAKHDPLSREWNSQVAARRGRIAGHERPGSRDHRILS